MILYPFRAVWNAEIARVTGEAFLVDSDGKVHDATMTVAQLWEHYRQNQTMLNLRGHTAQCRQTVWRLT